jgi:hypothetical protein
VDRDGKRVYRHTTRRYDLQRADPHLA